MLKQLSSPFLHAILVLLGVGLVQVYSSSFIFAIDTYGDGLYFFKKQALFVFLAFLTLIFFSEISLNWIRRWGWVFWPVFGGLIALTLIPGIGVHVGGASRWLQMPYHFRFEPSEFLKIAFSFLFASFYSSQETSLSALNKIYFYMMFLLPMGLLLLQPDFGSFVLISVVAIIMLFAFGLRWRYVVGFVLASIPLLTYLILSKEYRKERFLIFLDPWIDPEQKGFQSIQSMLGFHSGGLTGVGLGQGQGKLFFLPEAHTDFTMAVWGEETGFLGLLILLSLYVFLIYRGFRISLKTQSPYLRALSLCLILTFSVSMIINLGVVMGLLPTKGLTMPFMSYGGSSLLSLGMLFGLLINIEKEQR